MSYFRKLYEAATKNDLELLEEALGMEWYMPTQEDLDEGLLRAAQRGNADVLTRLLELGADMDAEDGHGETPLSLTVVNSHTGNETGSFIV